MVDLTIGVSYSADLKLAETVMTAIVAADARGFVEPAPFIKVTDLSESSVDFKVRVWCTASDYWGLKCDLTRAIKDRFDAEGIEIPFPTRTILKG
jgi:small conductance mechanosensitive channel